MHLGRSLEERLGLEDLPAVALITYLIAFLAWLSIVDRWLPMPGGGADVRMDMTDPGAPEAMALSNGLAGAALYVLMWGLMMVAMMYPSTVPLFQLYARTLDGSTRTGKAARLGAFMGTYALVWMLTGLVPLVVNAIVPIARLGSDTTGFMLGGSLLLLAGYQLSPFKDRCLRYCRSPMGFLFSHHRPGVRGAVQMSWEFSIFCVGCCWALFAFMVVVGSMNILWMALLTCVLSIERVTDRGQQLARAVGVVAGVAGLFTIAMTIV